MEFKAGDWVVQPGLIMREIETSNKEIDQIYLPIYKVIGSHGKGYRITAVELGKEQSVCLKARKIRKATDDEIAKAISRRILK